MQLVRMAPGEADEDWVGADGEIALADARLVERAQRDPAAFAALYERYRQAIYVYGFRRLGTPEAADDAASIIFMKAFAALPRFQPERAGSSPTCRSWRFAIAHNVVVDAWRRERRHLSLDGANDALLAPHLIDRSASPDAIALGAEEARRVRMLLDQLPERQRAAVELRLAGLSTSEVAHALGLTIPATKSLQFRAYRTLRDLLRANPATITRELPP